MSIMDNKDRYEDASLYKYKIEAISPENAPRMARMGTTDPNRAKYLNALVLNNRLKLGGRSTTNANKNSNKSKKKHRKLSRRRKYSKKNRKSMRRK